MRVNSLKAARSVIITQTFSRKSQILVLVFISAVLFTATMGDVGRFSCCRDENAQKQQQQTVKITGQLRANMVWVMFVQKDAEIRGQLSRFSFPLSPVIAAEATCDGQTGNSGFTAFLRQRLFFKRAPEDAASHLRHVLLPGIAQVRHVISLRRRSANHLAADQFTRRSVTQTCRAAEEFFPSCERRVGSCRRCLTVSWTRSAGCVSGLIAKVLLR